MELFGRRAAHRIFKTWCTADINAVTESNSSQWLHLMDCLLTSLDQWMEIVTIPIYSGIANYLWSSVRWCQRGSLVRQSTLSMVTRLTHNRSTSLEDIGMLFQVRFEQPGILKCQRSEKPWSGASPTSSPNGRSLILRRRWRSFKALLQSIMW